MSRLMTVLREIFAWIVWILFWLREIAGWVLLVLGLLLFYICFVMLMGTPPRYLLVMPLTFMGFILFRAGIHMLRVSAAALVCLRAQEQLNPLAENSPGQRKPGTAPRTRLRTGPFDIGPRGRP